MRQTPDRHEVYRRGILPFKNSAVDSQRMFAYFREARKQKKPVPTGPLQTAYLVPRLFVENWGRQAEQWLEFRFGTEKLYTISNVFEFVDAKEKGVAWALGRQRSLSLNNVAWADKISAKLYAMLQTAYRDERESLQMQGRSLSFMDRSSKIFQQKRFYLSPRNFLAFFAIMGDTPIELYLNHAEGETVHLCRQKPQLCVQLKRWGGRGGTLSLQPDDITALDAEGRVLYHASQIYLVQQAEARDILPLCQSFRTTSQIDLNPQDMGRFFAEVLPQMERVAKVEVDAALQNYYVQEPLSANLYLDYEGAGIAIRPEFCYGEVKFNPLITKELPVRNGRQVIRNAEAEHELGDYLRHYAFIRERNRLILREEERSYDFLADGLPQLPDWVSVYYPEGMQKKFVHKLKKVSAGVSINDMDLLEVTFSLDDMDKNELMAILADYRQKKRYHRLQDKSFLSLETQQLQELAALVEAASIDESSQVNDNVITLPLRDAAYLEEAAQKEADIHWQRSQKFREVVQELRRPELSITPVPASLQSVLRDYQVTGFRWLNSLANYHLGGILADDMGLGKTLQVLAFLLSRQDKNAPPSLVVAPTSLMYNWLEEIQKFTPALKARVIAGTKAERQAALQANEHCDILITTYNLLKRDIAWYRQKQFRYCILDEAQHIKNPATQNARAVKKLQTTGYFALTGTPIENTLTELWSIFDFLMPGYLLSHRKFKEHYEVPIVREQSQKMLQELKRHVMPFILRRMKKDVLTELPDKTESRLLCELTAKQEKIYKAWFIKSRQEFEQELSQNGFGESRIKILALLTRLRQIACDPSLFLEDYDGGSGKLDTLSELVSEAVTGGHRLLIFSQFTTMLHRIGERLQELDISYFYLDGATPALERMNLVREFNAGQRAVFLISLKAGGTGLNLVGADMVIHFDPWWNPAVEDQATDRAYRLGQKNKVQVIKLIAKDTIEEKIYKLQEKKKSLIDQMIQPGENFLSKLSEDEIRALFAK